MARRLDDETYLSDINKMSLDELQRYKERLIKDIDSGRVGPARVAGNIASSAFTGVFGGIVLGAVAGLWSRKNESSTAKASTVGLLTAVITGIAAMVGKYFSLSRKDHLEMDRQNNNLLTHIERVQFKKMQEQQEQQEQNPQQTFSPVYNEPSYSETTPMDQNYYYNDQPQYYYNNLPQQQSYNTGYGNDYWTGNANKYDYNSNQYQYNDYGQPSHVERYYNEQIPGFNNSSYAPSY